jgi:hypothetical protein
MKIQTNEASVNTKTVTILSSKKCFFYLSTKSCFYFSYPQQMLITKERKNQKILHNINVRIFV